MKNHNEEIEFLAESLFKMLGVITLSTPQVAEVTGRSEISLKVDRCEGVGIPYVKEKRTVKYSVYDIAKYIVANKVKVMS